MAAEIGIAIAAELSKVAVFAALKKIREGASLIRHFDDDLRQLQINLNSVQAFLKDADKAFQNRDLEFTKIWIQEVHDVALEAEDVIELIAASTASDTQGSSSSSSHFFPLFSPGFMNLGRRKSDYSCRQMRSMVLEIRKINSRLQKIKKDAISSVQTLVSQEHIDFPFDTEDLWKRSEVIFEEHASVDMEAKVDKVVSLFNKQRVVAVVGMGGSGKTRLLQHVYRLMKSRFGICIWLCISQSYSIKQLQLDVLQRLGISTHGGSVSSVSVLEATIYNAMKDKQCFVVLDDVWGLGDKERDQYLGSVANKIRSIGFPENQGCKFLISTRDFTVAKQFGAQVYKMPLLSKDKSRELFMKHLLPHSQIGNMVMSENQDKLVGKLLKKCGGLPLAIIVVAGVMKHQHPDQWPSTVQHVEMFSSSSSTAPNRPPQSPVITVLRLSFNALELWVKPCFVFLGVFSEDEKIESEQLIGMWMAEGFVASEDDGLRMLKHLSNRCLVQLQQRPPNLDEQWSTSRNYWVTIHDLVHDLAVILYKEIGGIIYQGSSSSSSFYQRGKRILRIRISNPMMDVFVCPSSVRLLSFGRDCGRDCSLIEKRTLANARALRILHFDQNCLTSLPKCVGKLQLLKFLDISDTRIRMLPSCIRHLKLLQYLYINSDHDVPPWVGELQSLIHFSNLRMHATWKEVIKIMPSLKVVHGIWIEIGRNGDGRDTGRSGRKKKKKDKIWTWDDAFGQFRQLQQVRLHVYDFKKGVCPPDSLECLLIRGRSRSMMMPREWVQHLQRLEVLRLYDVEFPRGQVLLQRLQILYIEGGEFQDYSEDICQLPQLKRLGLSLNHRCEMLPLEFGRKGAFPKLEVLELSLLFKLRTLPVLKDGAMPCLRKLDISHCSSLKEATSGWKDKAATLQSLNIFNAEPELQRQLLGTRNRGADYECTDFYDF